MIRSLLKWLKYHSQPWQTGKFHDNNARRNVFTGEVQFVLWKAGEQGHTKDYYHRVGNGWEKEFIPAGAAE